MICLACGVSSPPGSIYCVGCGRALGSRVCVNGHRNELSTKKFCATCGTDKLSDGTNCISLGCLSRAFSWGIALAVVIWSLHHLALIVGWIWHAGCWSIRTLIAWNQPDSYRFLNMVFCWILMILIISIFLPKDVGNNVRRKLGAFMLWCGRMVIAIICFSAKLILFLVEGIVINNKRKKKGKI